MTDKKLKILLARYKRFLLPMGVSIASVVIVLFVIFPQINSISQKMSDISEQTKKVESLRQSYSIITQSDDSALDNGVQVTTSALPTAKNIPLIFNGLSEAASSSNTTLTDFSINVGGIYGRAANFTQEGLIGAPTVEVVARVDGIDPKNTIQFAKSLVSKLPLSQINKIDISGSSAVYNISFFFKPYNSSGSTSVDSLAPVSQQDFNFINQLNTGN
ncbi:MAG TPA: hypothetical protein VG965_01970 [Patescibacteria group bacterium]|nr:hypothetical protein [Patescibacteria group bacterium]